MSVLIKGMEIPDKCGHCRFATAFECEVTKNFITTFNVRQQDCPLVPVSPHGRLIEKNAVFELIQSVPSVDKLLPVEFMKALYKIPTVIEAEEET